MEFGDLKKPISCIYQGVKADRVSPRSRFHVVASFPFGEKSMALTFPSTIGGTYA